MFADALADGRLVQPFPDLAEDPRLFWLVYPEHARRARKIRMFRDWLLATVRELAGSGDPWGILVPPEGSS
jgi:LysR family glycine cleavage system transcriptional activator